MTLQQSDSLPARRELAIADPRGQFTLTSRAKVTSGVLRASKNQSTFTFAFELDLAAGLKHELVAQALVDILRDLNSASGSRRLHTGGHVHRIAPDIVEELSRTDDAATTGPLLMPIRIGTLRPRGSRIWSRPRASTMPAQQAPGRGRAASRHAAYHHVGVARGLDLLKSCRSTSRSKSENKRLRNFTRSSGVVSLAAR